MKKLSIGLRVNSVSPAHTRFRLFVNLIPAEQDHLQATRASIGSEQTLRNGEFTLFKERLDPDVFLVCETADKDYRNYVDRDWIGWVE